MALRAVQAENAHTATHVGERGARLSGRHLEIVDSFFTLPPGGITTSRVLSDAPHRLVAPSECECNANRFAVNRCRLTPFSLSATRQDYYFEGIVGRTS